MPPRRSPVSMDEDVTAMSVLVCAFGDVTLDVVVRPSGPLAPGGDTAAEIQVGPGGQAANVAAWAAFLGARARLIAKRGADDAGALVTAQLAARGVEILGPTEGRNGVICSLVGDDGERTLASDRGVSPELRGDELQPAWLAGCDHLAVSGYALLREPARSAAASAVRHARGHGAAVSVDLAPGNAIRDAGAEGVAHALRGLAPDAVFATEDELQQIGGRFSGPSWIVKRGARGCSFAGEERASLPVERVVDTTGAGDALAAGWIVGGPGLALEAAARAVATLGSLPP